ncbi:MAG TPA: cytochrome c oxidase subunit 3 [Gemmatimonadaceae bacterium]|nr:cytochrome c oxidase subunit 3 [Gemmatimonadaceae bacterium]
MPVLANDEAVSHHAPSWWGNRLMLFVEGAAFAILAVSYFYIWWNFDAWPPQRTQLPDLGVASINLLVLAVSVAPFWNAARLAQRHERPVLVGAWLALGVLLGIAAIVLRVLEFPALHTRYNSNAYGSITWTILAVHLAHLLAGTLQTLLIALVMFVGPVEKKHYTDAKVVAMYWYFIVISWLALYMIVFITPRLL